MTLSLKILFNRKNNTSSDVDSLQSSVVYFSKMVANFLKERLFSALKTTGFAEVSLNSCFAIRLLYTKKEMQTVEITKKEIEMGKQANKNKIPKKIEIKDNRIAIEVKVALF